MLHHFSEDPAIKLFEPRPVRVPAARRPGQEWLNGPLVWAIDRAHSFLYFFPRDCPRILLWPTEQTTSEDRNCWMGPSNARAIAFIETGWADRHAQATIHRYDLPCEPFESVNDVGMWVSRTGVTPAAISAIADLRQALAQANVELRLVDRLTPLKPAWTSTMHASGIRLRHALDWGPPGWPHTTR